MCNCNCNSKLNDRLVISTAVTFADGILTINIPAGSYGNGCRYDLIVAQTIPDATIGTPVVITIGDGTEEYPLTNRCCAQVTACALRTRTRYPTQVVTSATGGTFRLLGRAGCFPNNNLRAIDGTAPAAAEGGGGA